MLTPIWRETQEGEKQIGRSHGPETRCSLCDGQCPLLCCSVGEPGGTPQAIPPPRLLAEARMTLLSRKARTN